MDIYDLQGVKFQKVHLFVGSADGGNTFEDLGQVCSSCVSFVEGHPEVECIDIEVPENSEYQLSHTAYVSDQMDKDKEESMFSRG